ncbi:hypothetical protein B0H63DRAFT_520272 [Podospora didyma]|uniref:Transcription initiation factor IIF subunit alpha n=1 Tax=Podospora didyma TaxID=330526 RepID=A0AAE0P0G5_9PEZI|nr:hypothetical protein B0H63DRAFT_520272 [Podospora didyma]
MSAPPSGSGSGPPKRLPAGLSLTRRKPNENPLVARKKIVPRPIARVPPPQTKKVEDATYRPTDQQLKELEKLRFKRKENAGWSDPPPPGAQVQEYDLITTKKALLEGMRYHIMRLSKAKGERASKGEAPVDVTDQDQFPRPVTLHRRDPRLPPANRMATLKEEDFSSANPEDDAEAERMRQQKAEREAQRALDQAQIAPVTKTNEPKKAAQQKKEKASAFYGRHSEEHKKQSGVRYEETLPWHLEDAEGKSGVWVGSYIAGLSELNCALVIDNNAFRMVPLERYYRFDEKPPFNTMSLETAENMMLQGKVVKRWVMMDKEKQEAEKEKEETRQFLRGRVRVKTESATSRSAPRTERQDDQELDFSGDEFQDDDEAPGFEADDEDTKDSKERQRRQHLAANLFGEGEERKVDEEERQEEMDKMKRKTMGKQTIKGLRKLEHAMDYLDSDSEEGENNPFTESSACLNKSHACLESESESEEKKDDEVKKEDAKKDEDAKKLTDQVGAGGSSKKQPGDKKGKLKRLGSPNLSDSSEAESNRKKVKTGLGTSSKAPSRSATPLPGRPKGLGGATSDGEGTAGEGSDGGLKMKNKIKLKTGGTGTPSASRAGSPAPANDFLAAQVNSPNRAGEASGTPRGSPPPGQSGKRIEASEIVQALAAHAHEGISLGNLLRKFVSRIDKPTTKVEWIALVKQNAEFGPDKLLRPKK